MGVTAMRAEPVNPHGVAERIRATIPYRAGTLTTMMSRTDNRVGAFLHELTGFGARGLATFPPSEHPQLVSTTGLGQGDHQTLGTAFGWWLRLRHSPAAPLDEAWYATSILPPHVQIALWQLNGWILNPGRYLTEPSDLERVCIVLAWCEQLYRSGGNALTGTPLLRLREDEAEAAYLLDLVPDHLVNQLAALGELAEQRLGPVIAAAGRTTFGCQLGRPPVSADADLVVGDTLLELKATQGSKQAAGYAFTVGIALIRQLLGYTLLDFADTFAIRKVGVYAARYGLLWTIRVDRLLAAVGPFRSDINDLRLAFALLWTIGPPART